MLPCSRFCSISQTKYKLNEFSNTKRITCFCLCCGTCLCVSEYLTHLKANSGDILADSFKVNHWIGVGARQVVHTDMLVPTSSNHLSIR